MKKIFLQKFGNFIFWAYTGFVYWKRDTAYNIRCMFSFKKTPWHSCGRQTYFTKQWVRF